MRPFFAPLFTWKEFGGVPGSNSMLEFIAPPHLSGEEVPVIIARRLCCRCAPCRSTLNGSYQQCVIVAASGVRVRHVVKHKKTFNIADTEAKKRTAKEARQAAVARRVEALVAEASTLRGAGAVHAPSPLAAQAADEAGAHGDGGDGGAVFAREYGRQDAALAAQAQGDADFVYQYVDAEEEPGEGDECAPVAAGDLRDGLPVFAPRAGSAGLHAATVIMADDAAPAAAADDYCCFIAFDDDDDDAMCETSLSSLRVRAVDE